MTPITSVRPIAGSAESRLLHDQFQSQPQSWSDVGTQVVERLKSLPLTTLQTVGLGILGDVASGTTLAATTVWGCNPLVRIVAPILADEIATGSAISFFNNQKLDLADQLTQGLTCRAVMQSAWMATQLGARAMAINPTMTIVIGCGTMMVAMMAGGLLGRYVSHELWGYGFNPFENASRYSLALEAFDTLTVGAIGLARKQSHPHIAQEVEFLAGPTNTFDCLSSMVLNTEEVSQLMSLQRALVGSDSLKASRAHSQILHLKSTSRDTVFVHPVADDALGKKAMADKRARDDFSGSNNDFLQFLLKRVDDIDISPSAKQAEVVRQIVNIPEAELRYFILYLLSLETPLPNLMRQMSNNEYAAQLMKGMANYVLRHSENDSEIANANLMLQSLSRSADDNDVVQ